VYVGERSLHIEASENPPRREGGRRKKPELSPLQPEKEGRKGNPSITLTRIVQSLECAPKKKEKRGGRGHQPSSISEREGEKGGKKRSSNGLFTFINV